MPHKASAKKRLRQNLKRHERNRAVKSRLSTLRRRFQEALAAGDTAKADEAFRTVQKALDQAGGKGVIHKNNAARRIARMAAKLKAAKAGGAAA